MLLVKASKCIMFGFGVIPVAFGALGTGIVFSSSNIGMSRNPDMKDDLFSNSLVAFALIETFVVIGLGVSSAVSVLL